jgi:hypothetical protein
MGDLRSVTDNILFGRIPVILGRDFVQILPVVLYGLQTNTVQAYL